MATNGTAGGAFSGRSRFRIQIDVDLAQTDVANNRTLWNWALRVWNLDGATATWDAGVLGWSSATVNGLVWDAPPPSGTYDFRDGAAFHTIASGQRWIAHDSNGNKTFSISAGAENAGIFGNASGSANVVAPSLATAPGAPGTPTVSAINATNATFAWSAANNGGSAILNYGLYISESSSFSSHVFQNWIGTGLSYTVPSGTLEPATQYYSRVRAANAVGNGPYSGSRSFISDPTQPTSGAFGNPSTSTIPVSWSRSTNGAELEGFQLQHAASSSFSGATTVDLGNVTSYTISGLSKGQTRYVRVRAKNSAGIYSAWTTIGSRTTDTTVPGAVGTPTTGSVTSSSISWSWSAPSDDGGTSITGYEHQVSRNALFTDLVATITDNSSPASRGGLSRDTVYYVRTRALNNVGAGAWSPGKAIRTGATVPDQVGTPTAGSVTSSSISWSWSAPNDGGSAITTYEHQVSRNSGFTDLVGTHSDATSPASRSNLEKGTTYWVRTRAVNAIGDGAWSGGRAITTSATVPGAPTLAAGSVTSTSVAFTRGAPSDDGGATITNYDYQLATNSSFTAGLQSWSSTSASQSRSGLTRATRYYIRSRATNSVGDGPWSSTLTMDTATAVPSAPPAATVTTRRTTSIVFTRGTPSDDGGAAISTYEFQAARNTGFTDGLISWSSAGTTQTATPLIPGTAYYIRYRARNSVGVSAWSPTTTTSTTASGAPALKVTAAARGTSADMLVTPPADVAGVATSYRVERRLTGSTTATTSNSTSPSFTVNGLTPGASYQWRASYFVDSFQSAFSAWQTVVQPLPNVSPGDYFDGSTPARGDVTFAWEGAVNNSTSRTNGVDVSGWGLIIGGVGAAAALQRITGGRSGSRAARATFIVDQEIAGATYAVGTSAGPTSGGAAVAEGGIYFGSAYVRPSKAQRLHARIRWNNASGTFITSETGEDIIVTSTTGWTRLSVSGTAPAGAVYANIVVETGVGEGYSPWISGDTLDVDDAMITVGALYPWFSGDTKDTATFIYNWLGTPNASVSQRVNNPALPPDPLLDPDCPPIPGAPQPPKIDDSCIDEVTSWRRWWAIIPESEVTEWLAVVPTLTITTGDDEARQVRIRFYPNPGNVPPSGDTGLEIESEQAISYIPANTTFVIDGVSRRVTAEVGGDGIQRPASHLLYGQDGGPATWPTLRCGIGYLISFDLPLETEEIELSVGVELTTRMM